MARLDWEQVRERSQAVLDLAPDNLDAQQFLAAAERNLSRGGPAAGEATAPTPEPTPPITTVVTQHPTAFANGRYQVKQFLGEGGKKKVYLAHDSPLRCQRRGNDSSPPASLPTACTLKYPQSPATR